eukprot:scaffold1163_cov362-Prasinococcus_capsulatus_cf.AAC.20
MRSGSVDRRRAPSLDQVLMMNDGRLRPEGRPLLGGKVRVFLRTWGCSWKSARVPFVRRHASSCICA